LGRDSCKRSLQGSRDTRSATRRCGSQRRGHPCRGLQRLFRLNNSGFGRRQPKWSRSRLRRPRTYSQLGISHIQLNQPCLGRCRECMLPFFHWYRNGQLGSTFQWDVRTFHWLHRRSLQRKVHNLWRHSSHSSNSQGMPNRRLRRRHLRQGCKFQVHKRQALPFQSRSSDRLGICYRPHHPAAWSWLPQSRTNRGRSRRTQFRPCLSPCKLCQEGMRWGIRIQWDSIYPLGKCCC